MFEREEDLVNYFLSKSDDFLRGLFQKKVPRYFVVPEYDSNFGIADIVFGTYSKRSLDTERETINPNWVLPLASLKRGCSIELEGFQQTFGLSRSNALKRLNEYKRAGFLEHDGDGTFHVINEYRSVAQTVVAIEAKLRDWRKAISQAQRYSRFSDFVFVLLDASRSKPAVDNLWIFEELNIGLVSISDTEMTFHFTPEKNRHKKQEYSLRLSEVAFIHLKS